MAPAEDSTDPVLKEVLRQDRKRPRPWIANVKDYKDSLPEDLDQVRSCLPGSKAPQTLLSDPLSASRQATELPTHLLQVLVEEQSKAPLACAFLAFCQAPLSSWQPVSLCSLGSSRS